MQRIRVNMYPKGGHRFVERDGTRLVSQSWPGVIARLRAYRKRNKLPAGDPEREVTEQTCVNNPAACYSDDGQHAAAIKVTNLKSRVLAWFSQIRKTARREISEFASAELAQARAQVCAGCPANQSLPQGCSSCLAAVKELRLEVIGGRPADARLVGHGCAVLGAELATQVWLEQVTVDNSELPTCCWRRRSV